MNGKIEQPKPAGYYIAETSQNYILNLRDLINRIGSSKICLNSIKATMVLREQYAELTDRTVTKITAPEYLLTVSYREEEDLKVFNKLADFLDEYHTMFVYKYLGLSFIDWVNLPIKTAEVMLDRLATYKERDVLIHSNMEKSFKKDMSSIESDIK